MHKRLLNNREELTHDSLSLVCKHWGARVFAKVRLADVLTIENSGIDPASFHFALSSHFDFLVTDSDFKPLFAVEYDGPQHANEKQQSRDQLKNSLCEHFSLPILRVNSRYLSPDYEGLDVLSWFVHAWFAHNSFIEAQEQGAIPADEPVDVKSFLTLPGIQGSFPLWLSKNVRDRIRKLAMSGHILDWGPSDFVGVDNRQNYWAVSWIKIGAESGTLVKTGMRSQHFTIDPTEILDELVVFDLWKQLQLVLSDVASARPMSEILNEVREFSKSLTMCSAGYFGEKPDGLP